MNHRIALNFEDGVTRFVECRPGETVADAAYRSGINVPMDCREGVCGTCKCRVESGSYDRGSYLEDTLTDEEASRGLALACQMRPMTGCSVDIAATSKACKTGPQSITATLRAVERLSESTFSLTLDAPAPLQFLPGQYISIQVPDTTERRSYSFSSVPGDAALGFLIRNIPNGVMSTFLSERAQPGLPVTFTGPTGSFYLRDVRRPLLFLAGGTGLAPFLSMLGHLALVGANEQPLHLIYGVTRDSDLVALEQIEACAAKISGFSYSTCVAAADSSHPNKGFVPAFIAPDHLHGGNVDIYVCGPPPMVDAIRANLAERGVQAANFYTEKFLASGGGSSNGSVQSAAA